MSRSNSPRTIRPPCAPLPVVNSPDILAARILIVDNQEVNVRLLEQLLRGAGYVGVTSTMDPCAVFDLHRQNRYELILLDLEMPGMDGFQVMARLQEIEPAGDLPVLVISAQPEHGPRALRAGAKDFVSKPFNLDQVLLRVRSLLEIRRQQQPTRHRAAPPPPERKTLRFEIAPATFAWLAGALVGLWLFYQLWKIALLIVIALVIVGTFNPAIKSLEARGLKRRIAIGLLIVSLSLAGALLIFLTVPSLIGQLTTIVSDLPGQRERLVDALGQHTFTLPLSHALSKVGVEQAYARLQNYLVSYWPTALRLAGYCATTLALAVYFLADGKRTQGALYAVVPRPYHMRLARIILHLEQIVGGYMRGQLITSVSIAAFTFLLLLACRVPNALALSLFAACMDVLPFVGGLLAIGPSVIVALDRGTTTAMVVLVALWLYQQFENKILVPRVYGKMLRLSSAMVILALIAGWTLLGVVGALLALPMAAGLRMILEELGVDMPGDDSDDSTARARDEKTEAAYELMSAGASAPDAGEIAHELAQGLRTADAWVAASDAKKKDSAARSLP
jgi:putative heme transporter